MDARNDTIVAQPRVTFAPHDIDQALRRMRQVLESGRMSKGPQTAELVSRFCEMSGRVEGVTVASGALALEMAFTALAVGYERPRVVLMPDVVHWSDYAAAIRTGWQVMWAPVDRAGQLDIPYVMEVAPKVDLVLYVSIGGYTSPHLPALAEWCKGRHIELLTDMSHAVGGYVKPDGRSALRFGDLTVVSMFATKLVTGGEGGIVLGDQRALMGWVDRLRDGGRGGKGWPDDYGCVGVNARMSDLHAALANVLMESLSARHFRRLQLAEEYDRLLRGNVEVVPWAGSSLYKYVVRVPDRARFLSRLPAVAPSAGVYELTPWQQRGYEIDAERIGITQSALSWASEHVALPLHETLTTADVHLVAERVVEALG